MSYRVDITNYFGLKDADKPNFPGDHETYLVISHNGETLAVYSDDIEPEDCRFGRDLSWIAGELRRAYELGGSDAEKSA